MPPILAPLTPPVAVNPVPAAPSAQAIIPPAVVVPPVALAGRGHVATVDHPAKAHRAAKSATLKKRLAAAHAHPATRHVALRAPEPPLPPGTVVPPPGYYGPGPYERLVYGGPPRGLYGGWGGYRGRYPYFP